MSAPWKVPREERWRQPKAPRALRRKELRERLSEKLAAATSPADTTIDVTAPPTPPWSPNVIWVVPGGIWRAIEDWYTPSAPRSDGFDPDDAWLLCGVCSERWDFDPVPYGQYAVAPCGHFFLEHMTDIVAAFAGHVKPKGKANYRIVTEPPQ